MTVQRFPATGGIPDDGSVTNVKVASGAAVNADKLADGTTNKVMTAAERTKLSGIATSATANSSDATLLARANHTGTQAASTIGSGTLATARLGSGTADSTTFLRGDQTWAAPGGGGGTSLEGLFNVKDYGAVGNGASDGPSMTAETTAILAAVAAAQSTVGDGQKAGTVYFPPGSYRINSPIPLTTGLSLLGAFTGVTEYTNRVVVQNATTNMFSLAADAVDVTIEGIVFYGNSSTPTMDCFPEVDQATGATLRYSTVRKCGFQYFRRAFGGSRILGFFLIDNYFNNTADSNFVFYGSDNRIINNYMGMTAANTVFAAVLTEISRTVFVGNYITSQPAMPFSCSYATQMMIADNNFETSDVDEIDGAAAYLNNVNNSVYTRNTHFQVLAAPFGDYTGMLTVRDCSELSIVNNMFENPLTDSSSYACIRLFQQTEPADNITISGNNYVNTLTLQKVTVGSGVTNVNFTEDRGVAALTYGTTVTPNRTRGPHQKITVTNTTAFTIAAPTNPTNGLMTLDILNSSGGTMGTITWNAIYLRAGAFTNPANGKRRTITFRWDATNWVEVNRAAADI